MIELKAPQGVKSFSVAGTQFPVVNGVLSVPPTHVKHAVAHGFKLLSSQNGDELVRQDIEAAIAKAAAAIPLRGVTLPKGYKSLAIDGVQYTADDTGYVSVPETALPHAKALGGKEVPVRDLPVVEGPQEAGDDPNALRTDGPTFAEYVAAGYAPESYPPQGYASKHTKQELARLLQAELTKCAAAAAKPADVPTNAALKAMDDAALAKWLKDNGVAVLDQDRKAMEKAALDRAKDLRAAQKKD